MAQELTPPIDPAPWWEVTEKALLLVPRLSQQYPVFFAAVAVLLAIWLWRRPRGK